MAVKRPEKAQKKSEEQIAAETPKLYTDGTIRELPLPYIDLIGDFEKKPSKLSAEVVNAGKSLAGKTSIQKKKLEPYYFDEDITSPSGGDDYSSTSLDCRIKEISKRKPQRRNHKPRGILSRASAIFYRKLPQRADNVPFYAGHLADSLQKMDKFNPGLLHNPKKLK